MISKDEWKETAERAAAAKYGADRSGWYAFKRLHAVPVGIAVLVAAIGFGGYKVWQIIRPIFDHDAAWPSGSLPPAVPPFAVGLLVLTFVAFRPRGMRPPMLPHVFVLKLVVIGGAWLGLGAAAVAYIAG